MAAPGAPGPGPAAAAATVLMAARAELAAPCRLLPAAAAGAALRLQLSVQPGTDGRRRFRLGLRLPEAGGGAPLAEFDLRDVSYRVCGPTSHELQLPPPGTAGTAGTGGSLGTAGPGVSPGSEGSPVSLRFSEEREAQQWWTVLSSSLREARRAPEGDTGPSLGTSLGTSLGPSLGTSPEGSEQDPEDARVLELAQTEELALRLAQAIGFGDAALAAQSAVALARRHAELSVSLRDRDGNGNEISMPVVVEDAAASASITLRVRPQLSIGSLKEQVFREYGFHPLAQRWIIGQSLCQDGRSLGSYGVRQHGDPAHLYLLSLRAAGLAPESHRELQGWPCPRCTFLNKPTRPGCEMCSSPRPLGYRVPGGHRPDPAELQRLRRERDGARQCQQALEAERQRNFQQLLRAERAELVPNPEPFECRICLGPVPARGGVLLRDCLHCFCRECLRQLIRFSEEPQVRCPYRDPTYTCGSHLQEREIRALLSPEEHAQFLARGLALAERRSRGSVHCRARDCPGWCFCEDGVAEFRCPVCGALNCLRCKAIHEGLSCGQFQAEQRPQDAAAAQQTQDLLQALVQRGEAMPCPSCRIVLQKRDGCDWVRCGACHTEICWATKGPRWGPGGPGDTSGGCRCNVNGQRCHPQCQNCH